MPQMAPMFWSILFMYFISMFLLYMFIMYFIINTSNKKTLLVNNKTSSQINHWLW